MRISRFKIVIILLGYFNVMVIKWSNQITRQLVEQASLTSAHSTLTEAEKSKAQEEGRNHPESDGSRVIFYNVFVGTKNEEQVKNAIRIIQEQIRYLNDSRWKSVPLLYSLIGNDKEIIRSTIEEGKENSHILQYKTQADESVTLDKMYEYCLENPTATVLYIHSKGSFHPGEQNEQYRRFNMRGATGDECFDAVSPGGRPSMCNVCGARFSIFPHFHVAGNMFTAQCSYVRHLVRPSELPSKMEDYFKHSQLHGSLMKEPGWRLGRGRFAYEHWIGTHPSILPCDIANDNNYQWGPKYVPQGNFSTSLQRAPRLPRSELKLLQDSLMQQHPVFDLEGRLHEWKYLYPGETPSDWVLDHYTK